MTDSKKPRFLGQLTDEAKQLKALERIADALERIADGVESHPGVKQNLSQTKQMRQVVTRLQQNAPKVPQDDSQD